MSIHTRYGIEIDELKDLILGKIHWRKCPMCDADGRQYWDGETGMGVSASPSGINPEWLEWDNCDNCHGLGYILYYI